MDIRCPSCSTLYEFDEARITAKGVNVRCTACGQVFKVRATTPDEPKVLWMVKRETTGEVINFDDLSTLQRWIVEQKVSRRDSISKTGETWKSLGSINELNAFFKVVDELSEHKNTLRDTDGYLTASERITALASAHAASSAEPAPRPGYEDTQRIRSVSGALPAVGKRDYGGATRALGADPHELPETRPAKQSAPQPSPQVSHRARDLHSDDDDLRTAAYILEDDERTPRERYSMGDDRNPPPPSQRFLGPTLEPERVGDYTAEYAALRQKPSRWPVLILSLLLLAAGVLILIAAVRPEILGLKASEPAIVAHNPADDTAGNAPDAPGAALSAGAPGDDAPDLQAPDAQAPDTHDSDQDAPQADASAPDERSDQAQDLARQAQEAQEAQPAAQEQARQPEPDSEAQQAQRAGQDQARAAAQERATREAASREAARQAAEREAQAAAEREAQAAAEREAQAAAARQAQPAPAQSERAPSRSAGSSYDSFMSAGNDALNRGDLQKALNRFSSAVEVRSTSAEAHVGVARAYERMGRHDLAAVRYQRATTVNARYTPAWLGLGNTRRRSGDTSGACEAFATVLSIVQNGSSAERARAASEALDCP